MTNLKISELNAAEALTGDELVELVQDGGNVKATAQAIADLATPGLTGSTGSADNALLRADGTEGGTVQAGTNAPSYDDNGMLTIAPAGLTGSAATGALEITQDWNTSGNPTAVKVNVTNTASGTSAKLMDLQVGGASKFYVDKSGNLIGAGNLKGAGNNPRSGLTLGNDIFLYSPEIYVFGIGSGNNARNYFTPTQVRISGSSSFCWSNGYADASADLLLSKDASATLAQSNGTNPQESRIYGSYTSATNYQRLSTKTLRQAVTATAGASVTTTISIPKYTHLIGVTTRVTTELGTVTGYTVGDGTDPDLWGVATTKTAGTTTDRSDYTAVDALGPDGSDRTITLTATGGNFDGTGVIEVCAFYLAAEAD